MNNNGTLAFGLIIGFIIGGLAGFQYGQKVERERQEIRINIGGGK